MMLAMQQSTLPHHDGHHVPSPTHPLVTLNSSSQSCLRPPSHTRSFKPKLSLNTTVESTHFRNSGKGASLRLDTLSAVSPTARNTFSNAYQQTKLATTIQQRPKLSLNSAVGSSDDFSNSPDQQESRTPSNASISSASTNSPDHFGKAFYELAPNVQSILINSNIPRQSPRKMSSPLRPGLLAKKVSFRDPLQEEIKTEKYVMAHSDISFSLELDNKPDSSNDLSEVTPTTSPSPSKLVDSLVIQRPQIQKPVVEFQVPTAPTEPAQSPFSRRTRRSSPRKLPARRRNSPSTSTCQKRDSSDEDSDDSYPQTPVAGRAKRQREWVWTLGSLPDKAETEEAKDGNNTHQHISIDDDNHSTTSQCTESSGAI